MHNCVKSLLVLVAAAAVYTVSGASAASPYPDCNPATGQINVGRANIFTVLSAGDANLTDDTFTGPSLVQGNVGVGGGGNFSMSDGDIYGDLYLRQGGKFNRSGPATVHGSLHQDNAGDLTITNALQDVRSLSMAASMEATTARYASLTNVNISNASQSMTITGNPFEKVVLNLTNFTMSAGTFTLQGTTNTAFIINVSNNFSLNNAKIMLSGVPSANVLFNVLGTGGQVSLNQGTSMGGILLGVQRKIVLSGGKVFGRVFANQFNITSGGQVISQ